MNAFVSHAHAFRVFFYACAIFWTLFDGLQAADPVVSNISAVQRAGTKLLYIEYDPTASNENCVTSDERIVIDLIGSK